MKQQRWLPWLILIWVVGMLFPFGWLRQFSSRYRQLFDGIFSPEWMHILMHSALYAGLAVFLSMLWPPAQGSRQIQKILLVVLSVALFQELFKAWIS